MGADIITIEAGDLLLGVRANEPEAERWLRDLYAPSVVEGEVTPPPNVSVALGEKEVVGRSMHLLYRGQTREVRTTSVGRVLRAVAAHLDSWLPALPGTTRLSARVLVGGNGAVLVDRHFDPAVVRAERRLRRVGFVQADVPSVDVDSETLDLVLRPPRVVPEPAAAARLDAVHPPGDDEVVLDGRRLPLLRILASKRPLEPGERDAAANDLVWLATGMGDHDRFSKADLDVVARLFANGLVDVRPNVSDVDLLDLVRR